MPEENKKQKELNKKNGDSVGENLPTGKSNAAIGLPENFRVVFSWETTDIIKNPATDLYMAIAVIASMGMIAWGIYSRSFMVVVTFVMLAVVTILTLNEEPKKLKVKISENGIDVNEAHYDFDEFNSFSISYSSFYEAASSGDSQSGETKKDLPVLNLNPKRPYLPPRTIYIENEPEKDLEEFLEIYLPKEEKKA